MFVFMKTEMAAVKSFDIIQFDCQNSKRPLGDKIEARMREVD